MNQSTLKKIEEFSRITLSMQSAFNEVIDDWSPELPPLTILFSAIGDSFIDEFSSLESQQKEAVFDAVEAMLKGNDEELNIGASTGFLESIASKPSFSKSAKTMLGEESRSFLRAWNQFMEVQDEDL
jgi:hypothetical protein